MSRQRESSASTKRVGSVADGEGRPTNPGIRAGRDEALKEALRAASLIWIASVPNQKFGDKDSGRGARIARREERVYRG